MRWRSAWVLAACIQCTQAYAADSYSFDAAQFEKKAFEWGGYVEPKVDRFRLNPGGVFYELNALRGGRRESLDRATATLKLDAKARAGDWLLSARTHASYQQDQAESTNEQRFDEVKLSWKPDPGITLDAGKTVLKWGKGYAWNPVGFVERTKDPNDPELAREGYTLLTADLVRSFDGPLQTVAFTPVVLPVGADVNPDYGRHGHVNLAARLYLLYRDTDIDFYVSSAGSRSRRYGFDFSRNLGSNLEVHGEWARLDAQDFATIDGAGVVARRTQPVTSWLVGLRYLTERETTYIAEFYRNGTGYSQDEFVRYVDLAARALGAGVGSPLLPRVQSIASSYARQNPMRDYVYVRAAQKEPFDILYFTPAITAIVNLQDRSYSLAPEVQYTGFTNTELRARAVILNGQRASDFGEKQNRRRFEVYARFFF